ncbi:hypothetical protein D3C85_1224390 [compost metagenome]
MWLQGPMLQLNPRMERWIWLPWMKHPPAIRELAILTLHSSVSMKVAGGRGG